MRGLIESGALPGFDPNRAGLFGHSFGGATSLLHGSQRHDYSALVVWAPVGDFKKRLGDIEAWRARGFSEVPNGRTGQIHRLGVEWLEDVLGNTGKLDIVAACQRLSTPTLICHGDKDPTVSLEEGRMLYEAFAPSVARLSVIENAGHTFGGTHPPGPIGPDLERVLGETVEIFATSLLGEPA